MATPKTEASKLFRLIKRFHKELDLLEYEDLDQMVDGLNDTYDEKSEKWQDSEKGQEFFNGIDTISGFREHIENLKQAIAEAAEHLSLTGIETDLDAE